MNTKKITIKHCEDCIYSREWFCLMLGKYWKRDFDGEKEYVDKRCPKKNTTVIFKWEK